MSTRAARRLARQAIDETLLASGAADPGLRRAFAGIARAPLRLIAAPLNKDVNHGGLLRVAEAFRLREVVYSPVEPKLQDFRGAVSARRWQPFRMQDTAEAIRQAREEGDLVVALALGEGALAVGQMDWRFPCSIVVGEEKHGLPDDLLALCDQRVGIPMFGVIDSLNVATSAAIVLQIAVEAYRRENPDFAPVRAASRRLLGLPPADYSHD